MPFESVDSFLAELRRTKLLKAPQLDEVERLIKPRFPAPLQVAKELVRRGWLTVYQVNQLFQTNGQQLSLGPYHILDHLGKGGVSQVFKAWHAERNCFVALKVIHPHLLSNAEAVARFQREMNAVARLSHPNIVYSYPNDSLGEAHFFAMEFVEGTPLDKLVPLSGALPVPQACDFLRQTALGLQHAHEQGLVHRDIKPANLVQINGTQLIKILDFGLTRLLSGGSSDKPTSITAEGALIGTADYVAPEQARDARSVDIRADIYSLGCTAYYLLTGAPPFPGGSLMQKIHHHISKEPTALSILRPEVPSELAEVVKKMMGKKVTDRYATPKDVADALQPFCEGSLAVK